MNNYSKNVAINKTLRFALSLSFVGAVGGCAAIARDVPNTVTSTVASMNPRVTQYANLQARLNQLNAKGALAIADGAASKQADDLPLITERKYQWAKAQCWVRNAYSERHENDANGFPTAALKEANRIVQGLETQQLDLTPTALVNHSSPVRADLWNRVGALKTKSGYACSVQTVACLEVQLSRAGHENAEGGWRNANPYLAIAEDMATKAEEQAAACQATPKPVVSAVVPSPAASPAKAAVIPAPTPVIEKVTLNASALFQFDRRNDKDMLLEGKQQLDALAQRIVQVYASVESIELIGFTDRLGSDSYNQHLSLDRANTVKSYLASKGITASMTTLGKGKQEPVANCKGQKPTKLLTECLQPNRRVEIIIKGIKK
jgi:OmpA-OmpF porin, OOP family